MSGTLVIAARELRANTRIFVISAAFAVWPFLASLLPTSRGHREEVIVVLGGFIAVAVGCGLAVALGISTIGRELSERRMSFYFGKPVTASAIWFGKAGAAILTSVACFAFIAIPAYLTSPQTWRQRWLGDVQPLILAALVIAGLFFVSHYVSTILRSRSLLLAVDIICLLLLVAGLYLVLRPVALGGAGGIARIIVISMSIAAAAVLVVGPVWQLSRGRTDVRRGHAALSRLVWSVLGVAFLIAAGYVAWLVSVDPSELKNVRFVAQPARGTAVLVSGNGVGRGEYASTFLVDQRTGQSRRLSMPRWWGGTFSEDGAVFSWLQPTGVFSISGFELYTTRVAEDASVASGITFTLNGSATLSKDASQVAVVDGSLVSVFDTATHRLLAAGGGLDRQSNHSVVFAGADVLRIVEVPRSTRDATIVRVFELDMRSRTMRKTGEQVFPGGRDVSVSLSGGGTRMFVRGVNTILDGRTAGLVARVNGDGPPAASGILHDGTVATITPNVPRLQVYSRDGLPLRVIALPGVDRAVLSGEIDGGKLIVVGSSGLPGSQAGVKRRMFLIDVRRGVIERVVNGLLGPLPNWSEGRLIRYSADQRLVLLDKHETLLTFDPRTGVVGKLKM